MICTDSTQRIPIVAQEERLEDGQLWDDVQTAPGGIADEGYEWDAGRRLGCGRNGGRRLAAAADVAGI